MTTLLSVAIPTYNRAQQLEYGLSRFLSQITDDMRPLIEIHVADDCSTDNTPIMMEKLTEEYSFVYYERYERNIGLEKNLIACTKRCTGKYLWIFGDDDFLEFDDSLIYIISLLKIGSYPFYILNRTRRSFDLTQQLSANWMGLDRSDDETYLRLRDFCSEWGIISIIGFISVNIFLREKFISVDAEKYFGIMYPQLGMMLEAFSNDPCLLIKRPLVCHRTQTQAEKKEALGKKKTEKDFMSDYNRRDALYFGFRLLRFLKYLIDCEAINYGELNLMKEFVFSNILLKDFLIRNIELSVRETLEQGSRNWPMIFTFFEHLDLNKFQHSLLQELNEMDIKQ